MNHELIEALRTAIGAADNENQLTSNQLLLLEELLESISKPANQLPEGCASTADY